MSESTLFYVTVGGLPISFQFQWPFHKSTGGADFHVLHGEMKLMDGGNLHCLVSVHVSQVMLEKFPSLDAQHTQDVVINALRKEIETKQLEFLKASKRQPVPLSSRFTSFKTKAWQFVQPADEQISLMLRDKVYWADRIGTGRVAIADACDALYVGRTSAQLMATARVLASQGLITLEGEHASATDALRAMGAEIEARERHALEELQLKHAFEQTAVKK